MYPYVQAQHICLALHSGTSTKGAHDVKIELGSHEYRQYAVYTVVNEKGKVGYKCSNKYA